MPVNYGVCDKCHARVPATHSIRDGTVYLTKECPDCGTTEGLVSNDPATWQRKREIWQYDSATSTAHVCHLKCEGCRHPRSLRLVFLDLTNRCNMNCPICVANAPWMGFDYHPPLAYFENILKGLASLDPKPVIHLFGGEPTLRDDLFEIVDLAHGLGLRVHLVTNGLKLADEAYCKRVCDKKLPVFLGFDGRDPSIYERMRKTTTCYEPKLKALENLQKFATQRQDAIMCTVARHINDAHIADLFTMCHEHRDHIKALNFLPLTETWEPGRFEADISTTIEDVQEIVAAAFPDEKVEFASLGLQFHFDQALSFFRKKGTRTFNKVHPNCEAATIFVPDGERYRPISHFLQRPLDELTAEAVNLAKALEPKLAKLDAARGLSRLRGKLIVLRAFLPFIRRNVRFARLMKGRPRLAILRLLGGLLFGKTLYDQLAKHTYIGDRLTSIILPFEEIHSIESERMEMCAAGFAYEDTETGEARTVPACVWWLYNKPLLRSIMAKYGPAPRA
ncbi:MAG TPA: radical SAM protein [Planctomycetota bacterium]|nr:radical SAM protein [Planctomycetota bacterium]